MQNSTIELIHEILNAVLHFATMFLNVAFDNKIEGGVQYKIKETFFNTFHYKLNEKKKKKNLEW